MNVVTEAVLFIGSLSLANVTKALSHTEPTSGGNVRVSCPVTT